MSEVLGAIWSEEGNLLVDLEKLFDAVSGFMLYVTVALAAAAVVLFAVLRNKEEAKEKAKRVVTGVAIGYSLSTIGLLGYLKLACYVLDGKVNTNFWLVVVMLAAVVLLTLVGVLLRKKHWIKIYVAIAVIAVAVYTVVLVAVIPAKKAAYEPLSKAGMYIFTALLIAAAATLTVLFGKDTKTDTTKAIAYAAVLMALSYALSYVKFFSLPQGGSVTFASLLPLMLYSYMFGARRGVLAGVVYGLLQFIQSPQFYQPMQVVLDYPVAFGMIGLAGIARNFRFLKNMTAQFAVGTSIAVLFRYCAHVISGYYVFSSWAMEGYTALSWALVYNLFTLADLAIVLIAAVPLFASRSFRTALLSATAADGEGR